MPRAGRWWVTRARKRSRRKLCCPSPLGREAAVLIVERWVLGRLRHRSFYSLGELNAAIGELLVRLNEQRSIRRLGATRRQLFEELDRPALKPLPTEPYVLAEWRARRVGLDYHVEIDRHYYSVPYRHAREQVEVRLTARTVEILLRGERIAVHRRPDASLPCSGAPAGWLSAVWSGAGPGRRGR